MRWIHLAYDRESIWAFGRKKKNVQLIQTAGNVLTA